MQGNINLIDVAAHKGVKKFVLLTSIGTGDSEDAPPKQVYDVLKPVLIEKAKAEDHLKVGAITSMQCHYLFGWVLSHVFASPLLAKGVFHHPPCLHAPE